MFQQTQLFSHSLLVLKLRFLNLFGTIYSNTSLPEVYGNYKLSKVLKDFPCGIGIYRDEHGNEVLLKTWEGSAKTYEYFQFIKEVRLYELLHSVLGRVGSSMDKKYKNVRIPKLIEKNIGSKKITAVFEYMPDCIHLSDVESISQKFENYKLATEFWRYLGDNLTDLERMKLPRRGLVATLFTYIVVLSYALIRYPRLVLSLLKTIKIVSTSIPSLNETWSEQLVHRDFHFENVLVNKDYIAIIDFGDNALTHGMQVFTNSLHWEWDNPVSREVILMSIVDLFGKSKNTDNNFRALFAISAVSLLHDVGSKERLKLNFRCFDAVVSDWETISNYLSGKKVEEHKK